MSKWHDIKRPRRSSRLTLTKKIFDRDKGICFRCGKDNNALLEGLQKLDRRALKLALKSHRIPPKRYEDALINKDLTRLWDADHIQPKSEKGPDILENLRTVCIECHIEITEEYEKQKRLQGG